MQHAELRMNRFRQSNSTSDFKNHYKIIKEFANTGAHVLKLGRGYFDWEFFVRPAEVEKQLARDVTQMQGYLSPLGENDTRSIILAYERNFGKYELGNVGFSAGVLSTFQRISEIIRLKGSEELVIATPNYPQLEEDAIRHGPVKLIAAKKENGYNLTADEVEKSLTEKTSGVVLLNPNVVGVYQDANELGKIIDLLSKNRIFLVLDETNDTVQWQSGGLTLDGNGMPLVLRDQYPENIASPCVIRQRSFSKGDMLAEYRIGYVVAMPEMIAALEQSVGANTPPTSATEAVKWILSVHAKWAAASNGQESGAMDGAEKNYSEEIRVNSLLMDSMRKYVSDEIMKVQGAEIIAPQNGFNIFFRVEGFNSWQLFEKLLYDCRIGVNPGTCFGFENREGWVRFTLANAPDKIQAAMGRINNVFESIGAHSRFVFAEIEKLRTWPGSKTNLKEFLP